MIKVPNAYIEGICNPNSNVKYGSSSLGWGNSHRSIRVCKSFLLKWKSRTIFFTTQRAIMLNQSNMV